MKQTGCTSFFSAGILFLGLSTTCLASDIPESVDINLQAANPSISITSKDRKTVPAFSHAKHAVTILKNNSSHAGRTYDEDFTCSACHPGVARGEAMHSEAAKQRQAEEVKSAGGVKNYMHGLCRDCHKSMKKAELTTGPTSCKGCHNP